MSGASTRGTRFGWRSNLEVVWVGGLASELVGGLVGEWVEVEGRGRVDDGCDTKVHVYYYDLAYSLLENRVTEETDT